MPPANNSSPQPPVKPPHKISWSHVKARATTIGSIAGLFVFLVALGLVGGYYYSQSQKPATQPPKPSIASLTDEEIAKLSEVGSSLGGSGQVLNIGADALFRSKVNVAGDLSVGGRFNANGPVTLSELNISGTTALTGLNVGSNLNVGGNASFQKGLSVSGLASVNGNLNVSGATSLNSLNVANISVQTISISGPLAIGHLRTQGPVPTIVSGTAIGSGGTVSISGNDTAGTVNLNTGSSPPAGVLATITFRAAYSSAVHVLLTPLTGSAAATNTYVTRTGGGFQIRTDSPAPAGAILSFDYFVTQ